MHRPPPRSRPAGRLAALYRLLRRVRLRLGRVDASAPGSRQPVPDSGPPVAWAELVAQRAPQLLGRSHARASEPSAGNRPPWTVPLAARTVRGADLRFADDPNVGGARRPDRLGAERWPRLPDETRGAAVEPLRFADPAGSTDPVDELARFADLLWPSLPDDAELWVVPPAAFTDRHLADLDREQEGRRWNG